LLAHALLSVARTDPGRPHAVAMSNPALAPESIELPDAQYAPGAQILEELRQVRPVTACTAHHLGMDLGAAGLLQGIDLQCDRLVFRADACVADLQATSGAGW
jgi:hypothetical protein